MWLFSCRSQRWMIDPTNRNHLAGDRAGVPPSRSAGFQFEAAMWYEPISSLAHRIWGSLTASVKHSETALTVTFKAREIRSRSSY